MTGSAPEATLFAVAGTKQGHRRHTEPDWAEIHRELVECSLEFGDGQEFGLALNDEKPAGAEAARTG
jgi:hypothetical protein